jgi:uncharacterized cupredoxin-like copper-binding protein
MRRNLLVVLMCAVAALALAACGGDDEGDQATQPATEPTEQAPGGGATVEVSTDPGGALEFEQKSLTAQAGRTTFELTNQSSTPHDFVVEQDGEDLGKTEVITDGTDSVSVDLQAGEYAFYCSVPGHRQAGMEGTLRVR